MWTFLALAVACGDDPVAPADAPVAPAASVVAAGQPDVLVVLMDGLRADTPGVPGGTTGMMAAAGLAPELVFSQAYGHTIQSYIALGTTLTGHYPSTIPLCSVPEGVELDAAPWCNSLPPGRPTMGEVLGIYGYRTGLFTAGDQPDEALGRGFDEVVSAPRNGHKDPPRRVRVLNAAEDWWSLDAEKPRLAVIRMPLDERSLESAGKGGVGQYPWSAEEIAAWDAQYPGVSSRFVGDEWPLLSPAAIEAASAAYLDQAQKLGAQVGWLLERLAPKPGRRRVVVLASQFGIQLGHWTGTQAPEQMKPGVAFSLTDRVLRTTVHVLGTGRPAATHDGVVELVDLMPTVAAWAGAVPPAGLPGMDLMAQLDTPDPVPQAYAEYGDMLMLRTGPHSVFFRSQVHGINSSHPLLTERLGQRAEELPGLLEGPEGVREDFGIFDVVNDPLQTQPLLRADVGQSLRLVQELISWRAGRGAPPSSDMTWDQVQALHAEGAIHYW